AAAEAGTLRRRGHRWCSLSAYVGQPAAASSSSGLGRLQLLGLAVVLAVVVDVGVVVHDVSGVEDRCRVLQAKTHASELHLDLVDRLLPEVADVEQVGLGATDQLADRVDALAL